jgi:hypothetical protein
LSTNHLSTVVSFNQLSFIHYFDYRQFYGSPKAVIVFTNLFPLLDKNQTLRNTRRVLCGPSLSTTAPTGDVADHHSLCLCGIIVISPLKVTLLKKQMAVLQAWLKAVVVPLTKILMDQMLFLFCVNPRKTKMGKQWLYNQKQHRNVLCTNAVCRDKREK